MTSQHPGMGRWAGCILVISALATWACDQDLPTFTDAGDSATDLAVETTADTFSEPLPDTGTDPIEDVIAEDTGGDCTYPDGPYAFNAVGNTVGPMTWPTGVAGADETLAADLRALHCDPSVKSIFIQIAATS